MVFLGGRRGKNGFKKGLKKKGFLEVFLNFLGFLVFFLGFLAFFIGFFPCLFSFLRAKNVGVKKRRFGCFCFPQEGFYGNARKTDQKAWAKP